MIPSEEIDTLIIGGGLSGIYAAYLLAKQKKSLVLLEARSRLGGRILSPEHQGVHADLGPSWYWPAMNPGITALMDMLGLEGYPQYDTGYCRFQAKGGHVETIPSYPMEPPACRIKGGMIALIQGLRDRIPENIIRLEHPVCEIQRRKGCIEVTVGFHDQAPMARFLAAHVILALPPRLAAGSILFTPELSYDLIQAMLRASTWMAGHAKFFALYDTADWRKIGLSGQGFSQRGPMGELHDASGCHASDSNTLDSKSSGNADSLFGLTGFVGIPALRRKDKTTMIQAILPQLALMYGDTAARPVKAYYQDWAQEIYTATDYDHRSAHNHPEFLPPQGKTSFWDNTAHFAGTETAGADQMGGYLEGALVSARRAAAQII